MKGQADKNKKSFPRKILVAGGAGFIGSHLCERLIKDNYEVFCVDNLLTGNERNISHLLPNKNFHFFKHDVIKPLTLKIARVKFESIFHLASPASPNPESPLSYLHHPTETLLVNSVGTLNLLNLAVKHKSKFLFTSTSEIYGEPLVSPQKEDYWGNVNPKGLRSCYDEAKRFGEAMTANFIRNQKINGRIVRIFNAFGPRMDKKDGRAIVNFINQSLDGKPLTVYGSGSQTRSFCYIDDLIEGLVLAMFKAQTKGEVINIGNPEEYTILQLAKIITQLTRNNERIIFNFRFHKITFQLIKTEEKIVCKPLPIDDPTNRCPDISKAKKILGWQPKISLRVGLLKTIDYFNHNQK